jgi:hypothetical protein
VIILACITISLGIKKAFPRVDNKLRSGEELSEHDEDYSFKS